ncbi:MAG TPA: T9SS type A sorting domain-containing protein [Bacteroidia bacterium]|nr:T9SS type A sorting domain-containing protein [Bacteroidia bacterium]
MKSKKITLSKLLLGVSSIGVLAVFGLLSNTEKYEPRKEDNSTLQKSRSAEEAAKYYYYLRRNGLTGEMPIEAMIAAQKEAKEMASNKAGSLGLTWTEMGPDNVGGRTRCFLIDNQDPTGKTLYAGGVNGGLWKSTTGGATWFLISDQWDNIAAVSICQEPGGRIYVGTGELLMAIRGVPGTGNSSCIGSGIWTATDGTNFTQLTNTDPSTAPYNNTYNQAFSYVYSLGYGNGKLYAGTSKGLRVSSDGGSTFSSPVTLATPCKDIEIGDDGTVYASIGGKMYVSSDGNSFTLIQLPSAPSGMSNLQIASCGNDANYVYCIGAKSNSQIAGVWKSENKGASFSLIPNSTGGAIFQILGNQGDYACAIGVDPNNKDRIICGGLDLWSYTPAQGWNQISVWNASPSNPYYNHADHHQIVFDKNHPNIVYFTNDGGIYKSTNNGETFAAVNRNFSVTQFYSVATSTRGEVLGGAQDNGTNLIDFNGPTPRWATEVMGGDGFDCDFSAINPDASFASLYFGDLRRSGTLGGSYATFFKGAPTAYLDNSSFHTVIRLWESFDNTESLDKVDYIIPEGNSVVPGAQFTAYSNNSNYPFTATYNGTTTAVFGDTIKNITDRISSRMAIGMTNQGSATRVFLSVRPLNFSDSPYWMPIGVSTTVGNNDGLSGEVSSLSFSADGNHLYVGTQNNGTPSSGSVYRISNLNSIKFNKLSDTLSGWINNPNSYLTCTKIGTFAGQVVTSIAVDPKNAARIVVTLGNYDATNYVYRCNNANTAATSSNASNFTSIQGNLPKMPVYSSLIDFSNSNRIIIGTEYGIWTTSAGGTNWTRDNDGMANCAVFMLRQQTTPYNKCWNSGSIYAATHGRGIYTTSTLAGVKEIESKNHDAQQMLIYPNPVFEQATIKFNLPEAGNASLVIYDLQGKVVKNISMGNFKKGTNQFTFNNDGFEDGTYIASVNSNNYKKVVKFVVKK